MKRAFTMLELVIVIVLLGILASIGSEIFAKTFDNYIKTRSVQNLQIQSQIAIEQIAKRLSYRIDYTLGAYENGEVKLIEDSSTDGNARVDLIWHSRDYQSNRLKFEDNLAYSGFMSCSASGECVSNKSTFKGYASSNAFLMLATSAFYDIGDKNALKLAFYSGKQPLCYNASNNCVGYSTNGENTTITITGANDDFIDFNNKRNFLYQISTQINRLTVKNDNLYLFTCDVDKFANCVTDNFNVDGSCKNNANCHLLAKNVSDFRFRTLTSSSGGGTYGLMLKVCISDPVYDGSDGEAKFFACKTQVVE